MAEGRESEYEADVESEYESTSESQYESKAESDEELPGGSSIPDILFTPNGHRKYSEYPVPNFTFKNPFKELIIFDTRCPIFATIWQCEVELQRIESNGTVFYWVAMERIDDSDGEVDAAARVRFRNAAVKDGFVHTEQFERIALRPRHEIRDGGVVPAAVMETVPDNMLILHVDMIVRLCHGNIRRKMESDSSSDLTQ